jgi:hypothetical protein
MTQAQLDRAVVAATGESLATVRTRGFSLLDPRPVPREPDDLSLVLDCPFCGRSVPYPGAARQGALALAACARCDVDFEFQVDEVYASVPMPDATSSLEKQHTAGPSRILPRGRAQPGEPRPRSRSRVARLVASAASAAAPGSATDTRG